MKAHQLDKVFVATDAVQEGYSAPVHLFLPGLMEWGCVPFHSHYPLVLLVGTCARVCESLLACMSCGHVCVCVCPSPLQPVVSRGRVCKPV